MTEDVAERAGRARVMHLARNLRPENFQPWNTERPNGYPLRDALYALVPLTARPMVSSHLARMDVGIEPAKSASNMRDWLWAILQGQLRHGDLTAYGHLGPDARPAQQIPPGLFDEAEPDFDRNRLACGPTYFLGVRVLGVAAPPMPGGGDVPAVTPTGVATKEEVASKDRGGREPTFQWEPFNQEVVRAAFAGEIVSRRGLRAHMKEWCARTWNPGPSERQIERQVLLLCHPDIPDK